MRSFSIKAMQTDRTDEGHLKVHVTAASGGTPIPGARIVISYTVEPDRQLEEVMTDSSGNTEELELAAPPLEYSTEPVKSSPIPNIRFLSVRRALSRVVVPEFVVVHDGVPTDSTATNYWVRYRDYIKNVASSEIYSTWYKVSEIYVAVSRIAELNP